MGKVGDIQTVISKFRKQFKANKGYGWTVHAWGKQWGYQEIQKNEDEVRKTSKTEGAWCVGVCVVQSQMRLAAIPGIPSSSVSVVHAPFQPEQLHSHKIPHRSIRERVGSANTEVQKGAK